MSSQDLPKSPVLENENACKESQGSDPSALNDVQLRAIEMMVGGAKFTVIAETLSIDRRTLFAWRKEDPNFIKEYKRRRDALYEFGLDRFRNLTWLALNRLEQQIRDPYAPISRVAARSIVSMARLGQVVSVAAYEEARNEHRKTHETKDAP